jgi:hypothetical protein
LRGEERRAVAGKATDRRHRIDREKLARLRRAANAPPPPPLPITEASRHLAAVLREADLPELAAAAERLDFDENYSRAAAPLADLVAALHLVDRADLVPRVRACEFDATPADNAAFYATPAGRREAREAERLMRQMDPTMLKQLTKNLTILGSDTVTQNRIMDAGEARILADLGLTEPAPDDDRIVSAAEVIAAVRPLLGRRGPHGERLDTPEILACAELVGRAGGQEFLIGWSREGVPTEEAGWHAQATWGEQTVSTVDSAGPNAAARDLVTQILNGGKCMNCSRVVTLDPRRFLVRDRMLPDGTHWTTDQQRAAGPCLWRRDGVHWVKSCER